MSCPNCKSPLTFFYKGIWQTYNKQGKLSGRIKRCGNCNFRLQGKSGEEDLIKIEPGQPELKSEIQTEIEVEAQKEYHFKKKIADIIIPHHNRHDLLKNTLDKLPNDIFNIIIVSGGTFAENCNKGAKIAKTDNLIFMNDDIEPDVDLLVKACEMKEDIIGFSQLLPNENNAVVYGIGWNIISNRDIVSGLKRDPRDVHIPSGFLFRIKKDAWEKLGGFDERFKNGSEDVDLGLRAVENGMSMDYITSKPITHFHMQSEGRLDNREENRKLLHKIWADKKIKEVLKLYKPEQRVLITNATMNTLSGSEMFTYTLGKELERRGYKVDLFTYNPGEVSDHFFTITPESQETLRKKYDYLFINHNDCLEKINKVWGGIGGVKIFTSHGIFPKLEQPKEGADCYVGISKEVQDHLKEKGFESEVIYNGVDCDRFKPKKKIRKNLKKVLSLCKQHGNTEANDMIKEACDRLGVEFEAVKGVWNIEDKINEADLVVSLGRGAYESMACGRAVIVFDKRDYMDEAKGDGIVTKSNANELKKNNFSGRRYNKKFDVDKLVKELKKYNQSMGKFNREYALRHFNIKKQVDKYFKYAKKKTKNRIEFVGSSTTEYGIAKQLERKLIEKGFKIGVGGKRICYANDLGSKDPVDGSIIILENRKTFQRALESRADHFFCKEKSCMKFFPENTTYLPCGIDDKIFNDRCFKRDVDIGFVGKELFKSRKKFVDFLKLSFEERFIKPENIYFEELAEFYNRCKIVPNQCPADDTNMRLFEATACGALLITPYTPYLEELFDLNKEIIIYSDMYDLRDKINYYLKHDEERERIAKAGQLKTLSCHTYDERVKEIIKHL
jgi:glycosyltransferase involved in cell wall biosynthesis